VPLRRIKLLLVAVVAGGLLYLVAAYIEGVRYQMSGFYGDFGALVNRNLLGAWEGGEPFPIRTGKWCEPGSEPDWPSTRSQCSFVGGAVDGCSMFTCGRSCAVIGVPATYFDDPHFREALRVALSDLCAIFHGAHRRPRPLRPGEGLYHSLGCASGGAASLSVYIHVSDSKVEPPYRIQIPLNAGPRRVALAYFSAWTRQITLISKK
jgi:hypothetical protein